MLLFFLQWKSLDSFSHASVTLSSHGDDDDLIVVVVHDDAVYLLQAILAFLLVALYKRL